MDQKISDTLKLLRLPLAFLIVAGHANILSFPLRTKGGFISFDFDFIIYPITVLSEVLFSPAVALFFMISGYLFFVNVEKFTFDEYKKKIKKRCKTLFLPYLSWNFLYLLPVIVSGISRKEWYGLWYYVESLWVVPSPSQLGRIADMMLTTPICPPLWFIRDLMVVLLFAPLVYKFIVNKISVLFLLVFVVLKVVNIPFQYPFPGISMSAFLMFSIGGYIAIHKLNLTALLGSSKWLHLSIFLFISLSIVDIITSNYTLLEDHVVLIDRNVLVYGLICFVGCIFYPILSYNLISHRIIYPIKLGGGIYCVLKSLDFAYNYKKYNFTLLSCRD